MTLNKNLSILMVVLAILLLLTAPVCAAETGGACGSNLSWTFDDSTGTLTITGQGKMDYGDHAPWSDCRNTTKVVIGEGVTSVGSRAFTGFQSLHTVSLPGTLTTIGQNAFSGCSNLQSISLSHVTSIGDYAFSECRSLSELTVPSGVTKISYAAFSGCGALKSIHFHNGVTEIESYAFSGCVSLTNVSIPDCVKTIGGSAFHGCYNLSTVTLGSGLTSLGDNAFSSCPHLKKIKIPDGVKEIKTNTFTGCTSLQEVVLGAGVSSVSPTAFNNCNALTAFTLSSGNSSFSADRGVLYNRSKTELVLMPKGFQGSYTVLSGTTKIRAYACYEVMGLTGVTMPNSVTLIDDYAFCGCAGMTSIKLSNSLQTIGTYALSRLGLPEILIPASVTKIKSMAFSGCTWLEKITFTGNAPAIQDGAFSGVTATVYYPGDKSGWKEAVNLYGGHLTWVSTSCKEHKPVTDPGKAPTCTEGGMTEGSHCSVCFAVIVAQEAIPAKGHSYPQWIQTDADTHKSTCTVCAHEQIAPHTWDPGTVTKQASCIAQGEKHYTCTGCKLTKTEVIPQSTTHTYDHNCDPQCNICSAERTITHSYSGTYHSDKQNHWQQCGVCGEIKDTAAHIPGAAATEDAPQTCTVCNCILAPTLSHIHHFADAWSSDENEHWHICDNCPEYGSLEPHAFENGCDPECDICGFTRQIDHILSNRWEYDGTCHWQSCAICGIREESHNHTPGEAPTADTAQTCTVCGCVLAPPLGTDPVPETTAPVIHVDPRTDEGYPWWTLLLILGATAIGAFLFLNRKKR